MSSSSTLLRVDDKAYQTYAAIISDLRSARMNAKLSQEALASALSVRGRAVSEWETEAIKPTLGNLMGWSCELERRLTLINRNRELVDGPIRPLPGEPWDLFERRRLAVPLRNRRLGLGMTQEELGQLIGVSRDSIQRWELARVPPRPIAHVVWAQKLLYSLELRPVDRPQRKLRRHGIRL